MHLDCYDDMTFRFQRENKDHQKAITGNIWRQRDRYHGGICIIFFLWVLLDVIGWLRQLAIISFFYSGSVLEHLSFHVVRKKTFDSFWFFGRRVYFRLGVVPLFFA